MRILFVSSKKSTISDAYNGRVRSLERHCKQLGTETSCLFLGDLFFKTPLMIQILNIPFILRYLRQFDVVIAEGNGSAYVLALAKFLFGVNTLLVYDEHNDILAESHLMKKGRFDLAGYFMDFEMRLTEYVGFYGIDYFSAASQGLKDRLLYRSRNLRDENVEVILNGVDLQDFKLQNESIRDSSGQCFIVTYAGSYPKYQGIETLIEAAEILCNEEIYFKFMGFHKKDLNIKKEIGNRLREKAILLDWLPKGELLSELQKSDILIITADPSCNRAIFPAKFAEFLALAKPVIVTTIDESSTIVERFDCGFVCKPTADSIAKAILKAKGTSKKALQLKGCNGRRFAETELDLNSICAKYIQFLNRIIKTKKNDYI